MRKRQRSLGDAGCKTRRVPQARQRLIYEYWDGQRTVKADPMQIIHDLLEFPNLDMKRDHELTQISPETLESNPKLLEEANQAYRRILGAVRKAFAVKTYNEGGLTQLETIDLFNAFDRWWEDKKKELDRLRTSPKPTASPPKSPMPNGAACGPTSAESMPGVVSPSPSESAVPLERNCPQPSLMP